MMILKSNITAEKFNIKSGENKTEIHNEHTKIRPNYVGVALVAGASAAISGYAGKAANNGTMGYTMAKLSTDVPFFTSGVGLIATSPLNIIPDSFYNDTNGSSDLSKITTNVDSNISVGNKMSIQYI